MRRWEAHILGFAGAALLCGGILGLAGFPVPRSILDALCAVAGTGIVVIADRALTTAARRSQKREDLFL